MTLSAEGAAILQRVIGYEEGRDDHANVIRFVLGVLPELSTGKLTAQDVAAVQFACSSVILNHAPELSDADLILRGKELAERAQTAASPDGPFYFQCLYNISNALLALSDLGLPRDRNREVWEPKLVANRIENRSLLKEARQKLLTVATSECADAHTRSAAYCNLANALDHSGRWAEAYDFYLRSLETDPNNGNAAGNLAQLLMTRLNTGIGQSGHIAAVYDKYVRMAQSFHDGTVRFAGADIADRWDALYLTESAGHLEHGLSEPLDPYRRWVADLRLALSPAVEGLGTEQAHWDSSVVEFLFGDTAADIFPPLLAEMNVLKSDFLVSRRLAFEGYAQIEAGLDQKDDDTGYYVETLDLSLYGTQYSKMFLAQRSALDVLDKTAVVANEYFGIGDQPHRVAFRGFWADPSGTVREKLVKGPGNALPSFALSELALDMSDRGMYEPSQALRNAGTHRIVHAALLDAEGVTKDSRSRIDVIELAASTVLALQVTRSAYLYLIDLVASWNSPGDHDKERITVPTTEYIFAAPGGEWDDDAPEDDIEE